MVMLDSMTLSASAKQLAVEKAVLAPAKSKTPPIGFVYLMKSGPHYKIGRTNSLERRNWKLGIKIPVPPRTIHYVETDDPVGVGTSGSTRNGEKASGSISVRMTWRLSRDGSGSSDRLTLETW